MNADLKLLSTTLDRQLNALTAIWLLTFVLMVIVLAWVALGGDDIAARAQAVRTVWPVWVAWCLGIVAHAATLGRAHQQLLGAETLMNAAAQRTRQLLDRQRTQTAEGTVT